MVAYYNEVDPYAAQWLRNLIDADIIARGDVDERSIVDVRASDLRGYAQCHFFAGVGGWSVALRLAGWPDARPVWTGSCPCQPFSLAGKRKALADHRHLWPVWAPLVAQLRPPVVFGEQVEAAIGWGWLDLVLNDLETEAYACAAVVLPSCGVGAPHIRKRVWFVADADWQGQRGKRRARQLDEGERPSLWHYADRCRAYGLLADADYQRRDGSARNGWSALRRAEHDGELGDAIGARLEGHPGDGNDRHQSGRLGALAPRPASASSAVGGFWADAEWIDCIDGRARPVRPGSFPLAHGVQARAPRLRAYGNAIDPQTAAAFIRAYEGVI